MKTKRTILVLNLLTVALAAVGQSAWISFDNSKTIKYQSAVSLPSDCAKVAYTIDENKAITYYLTIESALEHTTAGTIYVIPGTNPTITRDCEIKSGVTLCIPYDDNGDGTHSDFTNLKNQSNDGFADKDAAAVAKNRKNLVTIKEGITLTNNGILDVAGKIGIGQSNQRPTGFTLGDYCEILMENDSKIINNKTINLYGYIKESSKNNGSLIENSSNGKVVAPLTIYDFRGGTYSSSSYEKESMPFSHFDFPNCHVNQIFEYGSKLTGFAVLYAARSAYSAKALVLGKTSDDCLFKLSEGSKVTLKYEPANFGFSTADVSANVTAESANYTYVTIDGDLTIDSLKLTVTGLGSFDSGTVECPICYKYQITQNTGCLTIAKKVKFLAGSSLIVAEKASCVMNNGVTFYQQYFPVVEDADSNVSPRKMERSRLQIDGDLTINADFGGIINTGDDAEGKIITGTQFKNKCVTNEVLKSTGDSDYDHATKYDIHVEYARAFIAIDGASALSNVVANTTYQLNGNYWNDDVSDVTSSLTFTINPAAGLSDKKTKKEYKVVVSSQYFAEKSDQLEYFWEVKKDQSDDTLDLTLENNSASFTTPAAENDNIDYYLTCKVSYHGLNEENDNVTFTGKYRAKSCILFTAMIMMADGTYKRAGLIRTGDVVISFNHETGKLEPNVIIGNQHLDNPAREYPTVHLEFSNGSSTDFIYEHGYFDATLNKYVYMHADDYEKFIGHEFIYVSNGHEISRVRLVKVSVDMTYTQAVSPITANHLNIVTDNMLSMPSGVTGTFNIFEYDPQTLAFDKEKMQADINKYGLLGYEVFKKYIPEKIYNLLPCKYFGVSIGKGLLTWKKIDEYAAKWKKQLLENM